MLQVQEEYTNYERVEVNARHHKIIIHENDEGITIDVYGENDLISTKHYQNDNQATNPFTVCPNCKLESLGKQCPACMTIAA